jgi:hypothetical protein
VLGRKRRRGWALPTGAQARNFFSQLEFKQKFREKPVKMSIFLTSAFENVIKLSKNIGKTYLTS